ncbi:hypothetical protein FS749_012203 [Ceratobasidium sp. UAMH 11750]|nr:hypothetical protein FS749_012203 [Ceratobasidium sp. UAMH 11750]
MNRARTSPTLSAACAKARDAGLPYFKYDRCNDRHWCDTPGCRVEVVLKAPHRELLVVFGAHPVDPASTSRPSVAASTVSRTPGEKGQMPTAANTRQHSLPPIATLDCEDDESGEE